MATRSTFYADGYRDGLADTDYNAPDVPVYAAEYAAGYQQAKDDLAPDPFLRFEGVRD